MPQIDIFKHNLARHLWDPLRRSILTVAAKHPNMSRTEVVNQAAAAFVDDPEWQEALQHEIVPSSSQKTPLPGCFKWLAGLAHRVWEERHRGPLRVQVRVTRHGISVEKILPSLTEKPLTEKPLTEKDADYYEQRLPQNP